jgi:exopolysaccharide production protein ExoQ
MRTVPLKRDLTRVEASPTSTTRRVVAWMLMIPFLFFAVRGTFSFLTVGSSTLYGGQDLAGLIPNRQFGVLGYILIPGIAYSIVLWVIAANLRTISAVALQARMLTLLALLTIASAAWSQDPLRSTYNGFFYLSATLFAFYLVIRFNPRDIMTLVMMAGSLVCLGSLLTIVFMPQIGVSNAELRTAGAWNGIFLDRTSAGKCLVYLISPALVFGYGRFSYRRIAYIVLLCTFIVKAHAFTALLAIFLYALFMGGLRLARRLDAKSALIVGVIFLLFCVTVIFILVPRLGGILSFFGRDLTLTGRTQVWSVVMQSIYKRPVIGYGYYAFWLGMTGESANAILQTHWFFGYAHNGMLEILLQLGLVGLLLFLITLSQAIKSTSIYLRYERSIGIDWYIGILFLTIFYNIDEATVVLPNDLLSILYIIASCGLLLEAKKLKASDGAEDSQTHYAVAKLTA